jgi:iron complex outermembrane receptor protein
MKSFLPFLLLLGSLFTSYAQNGAIRGRILSADGKTVPYAQVIISGSSLGTQADEAGTFFFQNVPAGNVSLEARFIGFEPSQQLVVVAAGQTSEVEITLKETSRQLEEVVVQGYVAYRNDVTNLATRTATPLSSIPQSIQVIPQQILRDQQAFTINEALRNVAGMTLFSTYQDYTMRGFRSNDGNFAYNGVRGALYQFDLPGQLYNVERLEAIKGPASSLFSNASPGGIINVVTKQPLAEKKYEITASYGTYNQWRFSADATGPLSKKLFYRMIIGYENSGAISAVQKINHLFLAPSLLYRFSDRTSASVELNLYDDRRTVGYERGILAAQRRDGTYDLEAVPIRWSRHNPNDFSKTRGMSAQLRFSHQFTPSLSLHALVRSVHSRQEQQDITSIFGGLVVQETNVLTGRYLQYFNQAPLYAFQSNVYAEARLQTGPVAHTLIGGVDVGNKGRRYYLARWNAPNLSLLAPDFSRDYPADRSVGNLVRGGETKENTRIVGGYIQDQLDIAGNVKALLGLRYDTYHYTSESTNDKKPGVLSYDSSTTTVLLPRLGLVYQPMQHLSLYASYSQGFQPQYSNLSNDGGPFEPEKGVQYEIGAKAELLNGKLVPTIAFYQLAKENILVPDPSDPTGFRQTSDGKARSRGVEVSVQGNLSEHLSIITHYTYNETINLKGGEFGVKEGSWYPMAPNHSANIWLKYRFNRGVLRSLSLNGGFQHVGKRNTLTTGFVLPAYTTLDAGLSYRYRGATLGLNLNNLADQRHYTGGYGRGVFWAGMPRSFRLSIGYQF